MSRHPRLIAIINTMLSSRICIKPFLENLDTLRLDSTQTALGFFFFVLLFWSNYT